MKTTVAAVINEIIPSAVCIKRQVWIRVEWQRRKIAPHQPKIAMRWNRINLDPRACISAAFPPTLSVAYVAQADKKDCQGGCTHSQCQGIGSHLRDYTTCVEDSKLIIDAPAGNIFKGKNI